MSKAYISGDMNWTRNWEPPLYIPSNVVTPGYNLKMFHMNYKGDLDGITILFLRVLLETFICALKFHVQKIPIKNKN